MKSMSRFRGLLLIAIFTLGMVARLLSGMAAPNPLLQAGFPASKSSAIVKISTAALSTDEDSTSMKIHKSKRRLRYSTSPSSFLVAVLPNVLGPSLSSGHSYFSAPFSSRTSPPGTPPPIRLS